MKYFWYGPLAQLVEQLTLNQRVAGSSPSRPIGCQTHRRGCSLVRKHFEKEYRSSIFFDPKLTQALTQNFKCLE